MLFAEALGEGRYTFEPRTSEGVDLYYDRDDLSVGAVEQGSKLVFTESKVLTLTASFGEGWTYSKRYTNFFRNYSKRVSIDKTDDGDMRFRFKAVEGDSISLTDAALVGIYATPDALPKLSIECDTPLKGISHGKWTDASFTLEPGTKPFMMGEFSGGGAIKGRGNTSWKNPLKPYSIKLTEKASLLDLRKSRKYALVPSYMDPSKIRNYITYKTAQSLDGITYSPNCEYVELYYNGQYVGLFLLVERIDIETYKIDIAEATAEELTGGYLIEKDVLGRTSEVSPYAFACPYRAYTQGDCFELKAPKTDDAAQRAQMLEYLTDYMKRVNDAIMGTSGEDYKKYVDTPTWVDFIIMQEISKNIDGNLKTSCYMYKEAGDDQLHMTSLWDFDIAYGNPVCNWDNGKGAPDALSAKGLMTINNTCPWFKALVNNRSEFREALMSTYTEYRQTIIPDMLAMIDEQGAYLATAAKKNGIIWGDDFSSGIKDLRKWLLKRLSWLDSVWIVK